MNLKRFNPVNSKSYFNLISLVISNYIDLLVGFQIFSFPYFFHQEVLAYQFHYKETVGSYISTYLDADSTNSSSIKWSRYINGNS